MSPSQTVEKLLEAGIVAKDYVRGPIGKDSFCLGVQPVDKGVIRVWEGKADIEIFIDPTFRQAVLNVKEAPRTVTRKVECSVAGPPTMEGVIELLRLNFPVSMPNAEYAFDNLAVQEVTKNRGTRKDPISSLYYIITGRVTATVDNQATMTFLTGFDEKYHFISAIPKKVESVEEAHEVLRGDVELGTLRQGEWFFTPVSPELANELTLYNCELYRYCDRYCRGYHFRACRAELEVGSSHFADQLLLYRNNKYVFGHIYDRRFSHHKPLFLPGWHLVTRNREITVPMTTALNQERMRRWD